MNKPDDYNPHGNEHSPDPCNEYRPDPCPPQPSPPNPEHHDHCCCAPQDRYYYGDLFHGQVTSPLSRSAFAASQGWIATWEANEMEGGKNFPENVGGSFNPPWANNRFLTDSVSAVPPIDGRIISGGRTGSRDVVNFTDQELINARGRAWPRTRVSSGQQFNVQWVYTALHRTRGYSWWITTPTWNPQQRISRFSLGTNSFYNDYNTLTPFWNFSIAQMGPTVNHSVTLPNRTGHHVLLLVWIVADTGMGFYQAFDLDFD
ncbi:lytic polysaccharide monooxygenase auxiliary activity family 9 protein [Symbiopectobacterium purcellii]|uniref:Lytic polysaccharide monooxygenase n=1 Tax=Symbiopectobacterium purcellii TaxID=2871826 RepID=A0ABX9ANS5_9ENTR|nr:lytic polysaccharide monooxygenase auxiliary activity family 9 protein [Symbiopectobacterium purcellii]QZN95691.1 lytic polysaccharide monooxygenase [Symbiopectobacterium purcellii]